MCPDLPAWRADHNPLIGLVPFTLPYPQPYAPLEPAIKMKRCSNCRLLGHNKRTCPNLMAQAMPGRGAAEPPAQTSPKQ